MQPTSASADKSHSNSSGATPAPRRRGRPRVHANDSAKKAAYRQRKLEREIAAVERAANRHLRKELRPEQRNFLLEAKTLYLEGNLELALEMFEQHESQADMSAYDEEIAREERRAAKPVKHNRACRGKSACLCGLTMSRGLFLTDAPQGLGKLVSGGYDSNKAALINDVCQTEEDCGGRRVRPKGHGPDAEEE
jgi:hypothetical protein